MITIEGFSAKQRALADIMWKIDSKEGVHTFIGTLHPKDQMEAKTVLEMLILAFTDEVESVDQARVLLQKYNTPKA
jgi:hypothetical protein